jgi:hypothetical protein
VRSAAKTRVSTSTSPAFVQSDLQRLEARRVGARRPDRRQAEEARDLVLQERERKAAADDVPRVGRDAAAGPDNARELGDAARRLGNEEDDQCRGRGVERRVGPRQRHRIALDEARRSGGEALARERELLRRWIDPQTSAYRAALDEELGERAVAAADVGPAPARRRREPLQELLADVPAPDAHERFVRRAVVEADLRRCLHRCS